MNDKTTAQTFENLTSEDEQELTDSLMAAYSN